MEQRTKIIYFLKYSLITNLEIIRVPTMRLMKKMRMRIQMIFVLNYPKIDLLTSKIKPFPTRNPLKVLILKWSSLRGIWINLNKSQRQKKLMKFRM